MKQKKQISYDESQINNKTLENETKEVCYDYIQKDWIKFNKAKDLPHKDITIGLFASNLIEGEHIEFIPTIEGFEVLEWASYLVTDFVSYYKLDEEAGSTGTIYDATGTNNGTNVGATNTTGKIKYGYDFDGSDDYIDIGDYIGGKDALSISIWIYPDSTSELQSIIGYYDYCGNDRALVIELVDGNLRVRTYSSGTTQIGTSLSTSTIPTNAWTHVAWTFDKTDKLHLYINGELEDTDDATNLAIHDSGNNVYIGKMNPNCAVTANYDGRLDEVGIWSRALNSTEVTQLYNGGDGFQIVNNNIHLKQ